MLNGQKDFVHSVSLLETGKTIVMSEKKRKGSSKKWRHERAVFIHVWGDVPTPLLFLRVWDILGCIVTLYCMTGENGSSHQSYYVTHLCFFVFFIFVYYSHSLQIYSFFLQNCGICRICAIFSFMIIFFFHNFPIFKNVSKPSRQQPGKKCLWLPEAEMVHILGQGNDVEVLVTWQEIHRMGRSFLLSVFFSIYFFYFFFSLQYSQFQALVSSKEFF